MRQIRKIFLVGLILIISSCAKDKGKKLPCIPNELANKVIAFYPFSNGSLNDFSGNNQNLTNTTTAHSSSDRNGNTNCAYEFDNIPISNNEFLYYY